MVGLSQSFQCSLKKSCSFAYANIYFAIRDYIPARAMVTVGSLTVLPFLYIKFFGQNSMYMTLSLWILLIGLVHLATHICRTKSVQGVSIKMIFMQMFSSAARLCTTTWLNGYVPYDATGDFLYQLLDVAIIGVCLVILHRAYYRFSSTYDAQIDGFHLPSAVIICFLLASMTHSSLNHVPILDVLWLTSLNLDTLSGFPQSLLLVRSKDRIPMVAGVYVFALFLSRATSLLFWTHGYKELNRPDCFAYSGETVLLLHIVALVLVTDFLWQFVLEFFRAGRKGNVDGRFDFSELESIV